jgi:predicted ATPase/class 3 adenylate cyclase/Tfp pilus assembly protein PilF
MSGLPTGTVTFLFTDVEGSTQLWQQHPLAMSDALRRHDAILQKSIQDHGGYVFKTVGDAFCAAFTHPVEALEAALDIQRTLRAQPWGNLRSLLVRIALHTGIAEERDADYFGPTLNHVARLLSLGHGGQTLLSHITQSLIASVLPDQAVLKDMGWHRLKDIAEPEHVYQLTHPDLPDPFPPLRSLRLLQHNLPLPTTSFVGREREIQEVKTRLATSHLVTLTGAGGCGKTRLALRIASDLVHDYRDGVWLVELAASSDPASVRQAIATALGIREQPGSNPQEGLVAFLRGKSLLLVLDNCEHRIATCAELAEEILEACAQVHILATSREILRIPGEQPWPLSPLAVPDLNHLPSEANCLPAILTEYEGIRLFEERAQVHKPHFQIDPQNAQLVATLCARLEGIPLAIELAASCLRVLSLEQLAGRLTDRFRLLTQGSRTAPPRQQTLWLAMEWSFDLLSEPEQRLLMRCAVFAGGWTLEAAETVCADFENSKSDVREPGESSIQNPLPIIQNVEVLDLLRNLVDKSLVFCEERGGQYRYRMLETVREYAWIRLEEHEEEERRRERHLDYFLHCAEAAERHMQGGQQAEWLARLEAEHDNLRAALLWCQAATCDAGLATLSAGLRLAGALWRYWMIRGYWTEGLTFLKALLAHPQAQTPTLARAKALNGAGNLARLRGDYLTARAFHEESLAIRRAEGDRPGIAGSLNNLGLIAREQGDYESASSLFQQSLTIEREAGRPWSVATMLENLGHLVQDQGNYTTAGDYYKQSLEIWQEIGDGLGMAGALTSLGALAWHQADFEAARDYYMQSLAMRRQLEDKSGIAATLNGLGNIAERQGDYPAAKGYYEEALAIDRDLNDQRGIACVLGNLGNIAWWQGDHEAAQNYHKKALAMEEELGDRVAMASSFNNLGVIALGVNDLLSAHSLFSRSLEMAREREEVSGQIAPLLNLVALALKQRDYDTARAHLTESLVQCQQSGGRNHVPEALEKAATLAAAQGQTERAARLWGAAEALRASSGMPMPPPESANYKHEVASAKTMLDPKRFQAAWRAGKKRTAEQAITFALKELNDV